MSNTATVSLRGEHWQVTPDAPLTFGRASSCTICLDSEDPGISRFAGSVDHQGGTWWLTNRSTTRPLVVVSPVGLRTVLEPGRRLALDQPLSVEVDGSVRRHALLIDAAPDSDSPPPAHSPPSGGLETVGTALTYRLADRQALTALFEGYLLPFPRYDPSPRSYADAADRLGWPKTTVMKRIEYLRTRLTKAGVPNLVGDKALERLAEHVLSTGAITKEDLALLP